MSPHLLLTIEVAFLGLIVGSYLNVVIYRLPRDLSTVTPRSRCPGCGKAIAAWDNIPVLSYLLLGGRCRHCKSRISARYPAMEALTGALFMAAWFRFGFSLDFVAAAVFLSLLVALAGIDAEHFLLPDLITLPGAVVGLALSPWLTWSGFRPALIGLLAGGGLLWALAWGWWKLRGEEGMGLGDAKMLALVGAFLGWQGMLVTLFLAALSGAVVGLALVGRGGSGLKTRLPFGVFLSIGAAAALFFGPALVRLYLASF